jgi:hypothetical protein
MRDCERAGIICRPASILAALFAAVLAASCYSSGYRSEMTANTELIAELADKLADYCEAGFMVDGRAVSSEEMGEFYYGLKKARAFATMRKADSERPSYREFVLMLDQYSAFVHSADLYRIEGNRDAARLAALKDQHEAVEAAAARIRAELRSESH